MRSAAAAVLLAAILRKWHEELSVEVFLPHLCTGGTEEAELHCALDFASGMRISHSQLREAIDEDINIFIMPIIIYVTYILMCMFV